MTRDLKIGDKVWTWTETYRPVLVTVTSALVPAGVDAGGREVSLHDGYVAPTERECWEMALAKATADVARQAGWLALAEAGVRAARAALGLPAGGDGACPAAVAGPEES